MRMTPEFELFYTRQLAPVEGGYVDHDLDKGQATWYGISTGFLNSIGRSGPISKSDAKQLTYEYFWDAYGCQDMDQVAAWAYCDALFNHSPKPAAEMLQHGLGVVVDGVVGPETKKAAKNINRKLFIERYRVKRVRYYKLLIDRDATQTAFLVGWVDRIARLQQAMVTNGLLADEFRKLPWYPPDRLSTNQKVTGIGAASFAGFIGLFWPDVDLTSLSGALNDPELLKGSIVSVFVAMAAKWRAGK